MQKKRRRGDAVDSLCHRNYFSRKFSVFDVTSHFCHFSGYFQFNLRDGIVSSLILMKWKYLFSGIAEAISLRIDAHWCDKPSLVRTISAIKSWIRIDTCHTWTYATLRHFFHCPIARESRCSVWQPYHRRPTHYNPISVLECNVVSHWRQAILFTLCSVACAHCAYIDFYVYIYVSITIYPDILVTVFPFSFISFIQFRTNIVLHQQFPGFDWTNVSRRMFLFLYIFYLHVDGRKRTCCLWWSLDRIFRCVFSNSIPHHQSCVAGKKM